MSVKDLIKKSVLELDMFKNSFTPEKILQMVIALGVALLMGLVICFIYNRFFRGVVYNRSFAVTLVGMTVLTCMVTLAISTNVVLSLGMVGALSIVRYRTAVKDPMDLLYMFWAITTGIAVGANMFALVLIAAIVMILVLLIFSRRSSKGQVYIVVLHYTGDLVGDNIVRAMGNTRFRVKSKTLRGESAEMAMEVFCKTQSLVFLEKLRAVEGVEDVTLIQYDGEYHD